MIKGQLYTFDLFGVESSALQYKIYRDGLSEILKFMETEEQALCTELSKNYAKRSRRPEGKNLHERSFISTTGRIRPNGALHVHGEILLSLIYDANVRLS